MALAEHALLRNQDGIRWAQAPAPGDPNTLVLARTLVLATSLLRSRIIQDFCFRTYGAAEGSPVPAPRGCVAANRISPG